MGSTPIGDSENSCSQYFDLILTKLIISEKHPNGPLPSSLVPLFQTESSCKNLSYESEFDLLENEPAEETHPHLNGFTRSLVLTQRLKASRKCPIGHVRCINILTWLRGFQDKLLVWCCFLCFQVSFGNRPFSYSRYWTGTNMQWRLMRGNIIKKSWMQFAFEKTPPHQPHLQASSSPIPRIRIWPIERQKKLKTFTILSGKPRSHVRILINETWPFSVVSLDYTI